ncbi:MAG: KamA family radical SAM protein [Sedimentisphaerales bacterium]|nr:KamA family radical SAM protein [Sedimentisphaerales bacterium]
MSRNITKPKYITSLDDIEGLAESERAGLAQVTDKYKFRANEYYLSLIDWDDPDDPIRNLIIPNMRELDEWGRLDPSNECAYTIMPGLEHKYDSTVLLLISSVCGGICRYCFRKRMFINKNEEILTDLPAAIRYIDKHKEITDVLLTGGDPLMLSTGRLREIITAFQQIEHVRIIRIGTKVPAFNPYRILEDSELLDLFESTCNTNTQLYVVVHFNHVRELTDVAVEAVSALRKTGAELANQTPLIRGINDDPQTMADLFQALSFIGVPPYYVFQCRPASGNKGYAMPVEEGYQIIKQANSIVSGLAKRARFTMSHATGKIEVVGLTASHIFLRYHRTADNTDSGKFLIYERNPAAYWLDDYKNPVETFPAERCSK